MRKWTVAVVAVLTWNGVLAIDPARAADAPEEPPAARVAEVPEEPPPARRESQPVPSERWLGLVQFVAGVGALAGTTLVGSKLADLSYGVTGQLLGTVGGLLVLATPAVVGGAVCAVGNTSRQVQGGCWPAIGGAVLGALLMIPLGLGAYAISESDGEGIDGGGGGGLIVGLALGWVALQPLTSTLVWNAYSQPRPGLAFLPARELERPRIAPPSYRRSGLALRPQLTLPLFAARF
jgi:hypothetical protein